MPITNYGFISENPYLIGQVASAYPDGIRHGTNNSGALIPFGRAVVHDTDEGDVRLPSTTGENLAGITVLQQIYEQDSNLTDSGYPDNRELDYMTKGDVAVFVETAVAIGDGVFFRHTANGAGKDVIGVFRNDADTATADQITGAKWVRGASAGGIAILNLNL